MIRSKCISCGKRRARLKVEARAPLREPVFVESSPLRFRTDYPEPGTGSMVEICRECLKNEGGVLGAFLLEGL